MKSNKLLKVMFFGGVGEIGKNMTALEYGDNILVVDAGMGFPNEATPGVDVVIPDIEYLKTNKFDSYVFENVSDIDEILATDESRNSLGGQFIREILIPTYEFNMEEGRTNLDILIEQVTYHKLKLNKSPNEYTNDFNLSINTISVPI